MQFSDLKGPLKAAKAKIRAVFLFCAAKLSQSSARIQSSRIALRAALSFFSLAAVFSAAWFFWQKPEDLNPAASPLRRTAQSAPAGSAGAFSLEGAAGCANLPQAFEAYHELMLLSRMVSGRALSQAADFLKKAQSGGLEAQEIGKMIQQMDEAGLAAQDNAAALRERFKRARSCAASFSEGGGGCESLLQDIEAYHDLASQPAKDFEQLLPPARGFLKSLQRRSGAGPPQQPESLIGQMDEARYASQDGGADLWDQFDTIMECLDPSD